MSEPSAEFTPKSASEFTPLVDKSIYTQMPFQEAPVRSVMEKWCEVNDSIRPVFVDRDQWNKKLETGLLEPRDNGMKSLFLCQDMQLPEMIVVISTIDEDTFSENPEQPNKKAEELKNLGETFRNAGIYIAKRLESIPEGRLLAEATVQDFFSYGEALRDGQMHHDTDIESIAEQELSEEETKKIDRWLAGDALYSTRMMSVERRVSYNDDATVDEDALREKITEETRNVTLAQYFRTVENAQKVQTKALEEKSEVGDSQEPDPWELDDSVDTAFLNKARSQIRHVIESPKRELDASIMRRGMELLHHTMKFDQLREELDELQHKQDAGVRLKKKERARKDILTGVITSFENWENSETTLREGLRVDVLKEELAAVREQGQRTGDREMVSKKEQQIVAKIQQAVSAYPYQDIQSSPSEIVAAQTRNCVGASLLAGTLLKEVGINYLVVDKPGHSQLMIVTSDDRVFTHDMLYPDVKSEYTNAYITGKKKNGEPLNIQDIVEESRHPSGHSLRLQTGLYSNTVAHHPDSGHQKQVLENVGYVLLKVLDRHSDAIEAYKQILALDPTDSYNFIHLSDALFSEKRYEECFEAGKQAIALNKDDPYSYFSLGEHYFNAEGYQDEAYKTLKYFLAKVEEQGIQTGNISAVDLAKRRLLRLRLRKFMRKLHKA
jgi:tetratricopeptide (TPR) repeat protein